MFVFPFYSFADVTGRCRCNFHGSWIFRTGIGHSRYRRLYSQGKILRSFHKRLSFIFFEKCAIDCPFLAPFVASAKTPLQNLRLECLLSEAYHVQSGQLMDRFVVDLCCCLADAGRYRHQRRHRLGRLQHHVRHQRVRPIFGRRHLSQLVAVSPRLHRLLRCHLRPPVHHLQRTSHVVSSHCSSLSRRLLPCHCIDCAHR